MGSEPAQCQLGLGLAPGIDYRPDQADQLPTSRLACHLSGLASESLSSLGGPSGKLPAEPSPDVEYTTLVVHPPEHPPDETQQPSGTVAGHPPPASGGLDRQARSLRSSEQPLPGLLALFSRDHDGRVEQPSRAVDQHEDHTLRATAQLRPEPIGADLSRTPDPRELSLDRLLRRLTSQVQPAMDRACAETALLGRGWLGVERPPEGPTLLATKERAGELGRPTKRAPTPPKADQRSRLNRWTSRLYQLRRTSQADSSE